MSEMAALFILGFAIGVVLVTMGFGVWFWWRERNRYEIRTMVHWDEEVGCLVGKITPEQLEGSDD